MWRLAREAPAVAGRPVGALRTDPLVLSATRGFPPRRAGTDGEETEAVVRAGEKEGAAGAADVFAFVVRVASSFSL